MQAGVLLSSTSTLTLMHYRLLQIRDLHDKERVETRLSRWACFSSPAVFPSGHSSFRAFPLSNLKNFIPGRDANGQESSHGFSEAWFQAQIQRRRTTLDSSPIFEYSISAFISNKLPPKTFAKSTICSTKCTWRMVLYWKKLC